MVGDGIVKGKAVKKVEECLCDAPGSFGSTWRKEGGSLDRGLDTQNMEALWSGCGVMRYDTRTSSVNQPRGLKKIHLYETRSSFRFLVLAL